MIRFLIEEPDGRIEEVALGDETPADLTVLDWLRLHRRRTGTKEGCGSGDCGACTVVVASPAEADDAGDGEAAPTAPALRHESLNACIVFVGALHGRLLVTVESLARGETLHPVQRAMVDEHGSQCGFCTPGFVMSLYALYRAPDAPRVTLAESVPTADASGTDADADTDAESGATLSEETAPAGLAEPTPVLAYRSAAHADSVRASTESSASAAAASGARPVAARAETPPARPMSSPGGWLDGVDAEDPAALSHRIDRTLGGNLCRCTGYRPIKRAAVVALAARTAGTTGGAETTAATGAVGGDDGTKGTDTGDTARAHEREIAARLRAIAAVPPAHAGFHAPRELAELTALRERHPDAPLLGGGTDLALEVTQKLRDLPRLIHTRGVAELQRVEEDGETLTIGSAVSLTRCLALLGGRVPGAAELLLRFGSDQIRNVGTIGGNIGSASPIGDLPPLLLALGASVLLQKGERVRELPLDGYFTAYRQTRLERGELIRAVRVPLPADDALFAVHKVSKRMEDDISALCGAFHLTFDGGTVGAARIAFGGMAAVPARAPAAEAALTGRAFDRTAAEDFAPLDDARASAAYRLRVAANLLLRVQLESAEPAVPVRLHHGHR